MPVRRQWRGARPFVLGPALAVATLLFVVPATASAGEGFVRATGYEKRYSSGETGRRATTRRSLRSGPYTVHKHHNFRRRRSTHRRFVPRRDYPERYPDRRICRDIVTLMEEGKRALAGSTCGALHDVAVVRAGNRIFLVPD